MKQLNSEFRNVVVQPETISHGISNSHGQSYTTNQHLLLLIDSYCRAGLFEELSNRFGFNLAPCMLNMRLKIDD